MKTNRTTRTLATALLALALSSGAMATAAATSEATLIGSWTVHHETDQGPRQTSVRIASIDERGRATGTYCWTQPDGAVFAFRLGTKRAVKTSMKDGVLKFKRRKSKYEVALNEDGRMRVDFKGKSTRSHTLTRDDDESGCLGRLTYSGEKVTHAVAADAETGLVGIWTGKGGNQRKIEIHVAKVNEQGQATAVFCWTNKDRSVGAFQASPEGPTRTTLEDGTLNMPVSANAGIELTPKAEDRLQFRYRENGKTVETKTLKRKAAKGCLTHLHMPGSAS